MKVNELEYDVKNNFEIVRTSILVGTCTYKLHYGFYFVIAAR